MQTVENEQKTGAVIHLDNKLFLNCSYTKCQIIFTGGDFAWRNTTFTDCQLTLEGPSLRTANLLGQFGLLRPEMVQAPIAPPTSSSEKLQ